MAAQATNTLIITGFDRLDFPQAGAPATATSNVSKINALISKHVPIVHWAPLRSFGRVLAVFQSAQDAVIARQAILGSADSAIASATPRIKSYFYNNTPLYTSAPDSLQLPEAPHLFFISPPPSPPAGWSSRTEEPPRLNTPPVGLVSSHLNQHHTAPSSSLEIADYDNSDAESVNGLEIDTDEFHMSLKAALQDLESSQARREKKIAEIEEEEHTITSHLPSVVQVNPQGKLTRRMTLHEPSDSKKPVVPSLTLKIDGDTLKNAQDEPALVTPTIILEWDAEEDDLAHQDDSSSLSSSPRGSWTTLPSSLKNLRTERPPLPA